MLCCPWVSSLWWKVKTLIIFTPSYDSLGLNIFVYVCNITMAHLVLLDASHGVHIYSAVIQNLKCVAYMHLIVPTPNWLFLFCSFQLITNVS